MYVRVRYLSQKDVTIFVRSKLSKIEDFRKDVESNFHIPPESQHLMYKGRLLSDEYTFYDYGIQINDVIQLIEKTTPHNVCDKKDEEDDIESAVPEDNDDVEDNEEIGDKNIYADAECQLYEVGDQVDARLPKCQSWYEGEIKKIVHKPGTSTSDTLTEDGNLLYVVKIHHDAMIIPLSLSDIRPCVRTTINVGDLSAGETVLINYNIKHPGKTGLWYEFQVDDVPNRKLRKRLVKGKLKRGEDVIDIAIPVRNLGEMYVIEELVPPHERDEEYKELMKLKPPIRKRPIYCMECKDRLDMDCRACGCNICSKKDDPEKILLCDDCDKGFHMSCLDVPLSQVPDGDWFCPSCKRDPNEVVAPGAAVQKKKTKATTKDWGRGMACVGKTKTCAMPEDHFGPIPGIEVGMSWSYRMQASEAGVHRPPVGGIHGRSSVGAFSVVVSGSYEDDMDNGDEVLYTGSGGRDLLGNKRTARQCRNQRFDRENRSLALNCAAPLSIKGGDAGDNWREGKPIRLIRAYKMKKNFPQYAPPEGYRYDGIYKVVKYFPEKGHSGFIVWRFLLRRDDPAPAPWEPHAKQFQLVDPDGYKEAAELREKEEEKSKEQKKDSKITKSPNIFIFGLPTEDNPREPVETDPNQAEEEVQPPKTKYRKFTLDGVSSHRGSRIPIRLNTTMSESFTSAQEHPRKPATLPGSSKPQAASVSGLCVNCDDSNTGAVAMKKKYKSEYVIDGKLRRAIKADKRNKTLWAQCLAVLPRGQKEFVEEVARTFMCIICQGVLVGPYTASCNHNFCKKCIQRSFTVNGAVCPLCRQRLSRTIYDNIVLQEALRLVMPGYDGRKK